MSAMRTIFYLSLIAAASVPAAPALRAQGTRADSLQAKTDSLEVRIRELEARLDSLLAALARGERTQGAAQTAAAELEALRAAAQAAAAETAADTSQQESRTRNLSALNPEISVTGDVLGTYTAPAGDENFFSAVPREFEFGFESALDPYTRTKVFIATEQDFEIAGFPEEEEEEGAGHGFEIEEGYLYWVGLPAKLGLKVGKFRQQIGHYNRWHTHALLDVERPLPTVAFLGEDGLIQTGASIILPVLTLGPSTQTLTLEFNQASNEALFEEGVDISFLGNLQSFWDVSASSYIQVGATGVYGQDEGLPLRSRLLGLDFAYRWRPPGRSLYRDFTLKGEWYFGEKDLGGSALTGNGGYLQANFRLNRRWILGARADYLDGFEGGTELLQLVSNVTWWQSEWVYLRLQYNFVKPNDGDGNHTLLLQTVWAMGPHKHEAY
ncbi:MAG: hypothetical protein JSU87_11225 [Gemmatimonadota bacterium]|nr:MAG: hypothetical protein JSU87_11225 [Gemmatimonadota bacterium]